MRNSLGASGHKMDASWNCTRSRHILYLGGSDFEEGHTTKHREFLLIVIASTCFAMLTFLDWWVNDECFPFVKHLRTIFQTISITLVLVALKLFYSDQVQTRLENGKIDEDEESELISAILT